jgi:hypothetical protein
MSKKPDYLLNCSWIGSACHFADKLISLAPRDVKSAEDLSMDTIAKMARVKTLIKRKNELGHIKCSRRVAVHLSFCLQSLLKMCKSRSRNIRNLKCIAAECVRSTIEEKICLKVLDISNRKDYHLAVQEKEHNFTKMDDIRQWNVCRKLEDTSWILFKVLKLCKQLAVLKPESALSAYKKNALAEIRAFMEDETKTHSVKMKVHLESLEEDLSEQIVLVGHLEKMSIDLEKDSASMLESDCDCSVEYCRVLFHPNKARLETDHKNCKSAKYLGYDPKSRFSSNPVDEHHLDEADEHLLYQYHDDEDVEIYDGFDLEGGLA